MNFDKVSDLVRVNADARDAEEMALRLRPYIIAGELANVAGRGRVFKVWDPNGRALAHIWLQDSIMGSGPKKGWLVASGARRNFFEQKGIQRS